MSETNNMAVEVLKRFDAIATKLGTTAERVWQFSVAAKAVEARRDIQHGFSEFLFVALMWGWSLFIYSTKLPVEGQFQSHPGDLTSGGYALVGTGIATFIGGCLILDDAISKIINGYADAQMTEKSAFEDLMGDIADLRD